MTKLSKASRISVQISGGYLTNFINTAVIMLLLAGLLFAFSSGAEEARSLPPSTLDQSPMPEAKEEVAVFAGGCFWGMQGVYQHVKGVTNAVSGYAGGDKDTAHYDLVGSAARAMPRPCASPTIRARFLTANCCGFFSRWRMTRPNSTAKAPTSAHNIARPSFP